MTYFDRSLRVVQNLIESFHGSMFRKCHASSLAVFRIAFGEFIFANSVYLSNIYNACKMCLNVTCLIRLNAVHSWLHTFAWKILLYQYINYDNLIILSLNYHFTGFAMVVDTLYERGLINAELVWKEDECRFPVFHFIRPLPLDWMYFIYFIMLIGALILLKYY